MTKTALFAGLLIAELGIPAFAADERIDLKSSLNAGQIELTLTAKNEGATVELKIKNVTKDKLLLVIPKGKTPIDVYNNPIQVVAAEGKNIDLMPDGETTASFPMEQPGPGGWSAGSVIIRVTPSPSKK